MSQVIPAATAYQKILAKAIIGSREALGKSADLSAQQELLKRITELVNKTYAAHKDILAGIDKASSIHDEQKKAEMQSQGGGTPGQGQVPQGLPAGGPPSAEEIQRMMQQGGTPQGIPR